MSVKLNPAYRSVDKVGYGKGKTTGSVPANNIPSLGIVGVASGSVPAEVSASTKAVKALGRQADEVCDPATTASAGSKAAQFPPGGNSHAFFRNRNSILAREAPRDRGAPWQRGFPKSANRCGHQPRPEGHRDARAYVSANLGAAREGARGLLRRVPEPAGYQQLRRPPSCAASRRRIKSLGQTIRWPPNRTHGFNNSSLERSKANGR